MIINVNVLMDSGVKIAPGKVQLDVQAVHATKMPFVMRFQVKNCHIVVYVQSDTPETTVRRN